jgi:hypothetical protein
MIVRAYADDLMYVIEAPADSKFAFDAEGVGELILLQELSNGSCVERRLPASVVVKAAHREFFGLRILDARSPMPHPEIIDAASRKK